MTNVLVLAPHTDDGELGCGGTIAKLLERGCDVYCTAFSIAEDSVPLAYPRDILDSEVRSATQRLGIKPSNLEVLRYKVRRFPEFRQEILEELVRLNREIKPDIVFLPSSHDIHQDHKIVHEEGLRAFKKTSLLGYEFMWNNFAFGSTYLSVLERRHLDLKIAALKEYASQSDRLYTMGDMIEGCARYRGLQISEQYAEAFEVIRWIDR